MAAWWTRRVQYLEVRLPAEVQVPAPPPYSRTRHLLPKRSQRLQETSWLHLAARGGLIGGAVGAMAILLYTLVLSLLGQVDSLPWTDARGIQPGSDIAALLAGLVAVLGVSIE